MTSDHIHRVDLNLLKVFDALYTARHLTRAGEKIGLTQPAMSHSLRRLRDLFQDELFMRASGGMVPTPRADFLAGHISEALERVRRALLADDRFDPTTAIHTFRVGCNDYGSLLVMPSLIAEIRAVAPGVNLRTLHIATARSNRQTYAAAYDDLDSDKIDLAIMHQRDHPPRFQEKLLYSEPAICICAEGNERIGATLDLETFVALGHVRVYFGNSESPSWVDEYLATQGLKRRVVMTLPHFSAAPLAIANSDLIATVPLTTARAFSTTVGLRLLEPPIPLTPNHVVQVWHRRHEAAASHRWLREMVAKSCAQL